MCPRIPHGVFILCAVAAPSLYAGEKSPSPDDVRKAVTRSLPFIEKAGLAWIKKRDCMSCHHVPFMLWSHHEAQANGIKVDAEKLEEWTTWSVEKSLATRAFFKLNAKIVESLPEPLRPKLTDLIDEGFTHEKDFVAALTKTLSPEELTQHQAAIVKQAAVAKKGAVNDGGGLDTMTQLFLGRTPDLLGAKAAPFYASTAELIVRWQESDGQWKAAGQLPSRRWARPSADQATTLWTILALSSYSEADPRIDRSIKQAHAAVKKAKADPNLEWLVARLLYEQKFGTPEEATALSKQLLKRQNADGGWSVTPDKASEAFSTGQSLYALRLTGVSPKDVALRKGQQFLVETQTPDGSWITPSATTSQGGSERLKKLEPIYRFWGTAWAAIGLSRSLSEK